MIGLKPFVVFRIVIVSHLYFKLRVLVLILDCKINCTKYNLRHRLRDSFTKLKIHRPYVVLWGLSCIQFSNILLTLIPGRIIMIVLKNTTICKTSKIFYFSDPIPPLVMSGLVSSMFHHNFKNPSIT